MGERRGTKALEIWCRRCTDGYRGVSVDNMTTSWRDGLAFCALIHRFRPELIEFDRLNPENAHYNNELAFTTAERHLGIPALLDAEDMVECHAPDRLSVLTYVAQFYRTFGEESFAMGLISPGRNSPLKRELSEGSPSTPARTSEGEQPPKKNALPAGLLARREVCTACGEAVFLAERLRLSGRTFHRRCFRCARCGAQLSPANCYETESRAFCCEVCPDEVRGEFSDDDEDDAHAAAPAKEAALASAATADVQDEYSVSFESALDDDSAHPVTSAPDLDMISAHSSTNQQKHPASPGPGDGAAASGGGLVSSRRSLFENIETASGGERRTLVKDDIIAAQIKDVVTEEDKENRQQDVEIKVEENIDDDEKKVATIAIREFLNLNDEVKDDIPDMDAQEVPQTEPPVLPKSEPPELPKTEPPPLVTRPEKTESGLDESSQVKPTPPLRPPPISIDNDVNSGTVCIPSSASTNDKTSTSDDEASTTKESVTNSSDQKMNEPIVPEILVEKVDDQIYPDDLNPFGDDDEPPVEKKPAPRRVVSLNPFGSDSEEEEEEKKPTPRKLIPVEPCLNPFGDDEEEDEPVKTRTPVPRPRSFNTDLVSGRPSPAPRHSMHPSSSPTGSMRRKKKPPPPPPGTVSANTSPLPSPGGTLNKSRKTRRAPLPPSMAGTPVEKEAKDEINRSMQNAVAPEKSNEGMWKRKKRPAPGLPIPPRRQIITLPMNEVRKELEMIEVQQRGLEKQGVRLEALIREQLEKTCDAEDEESLPIEAEEMVLQLMDLVMEKNELFRRQAELMYMKRQQRLEEQQVELEWQIRCLLQKPNKDDAELEKEEALIARLVTLVEQRNEIVDCLEMDRKREADEDQSVRERRQMMTERHMNQEEKETPKSKAKNLKLKLLQKNKKSKEEKEKKSKEEKKNKEEKKRKKSNGEVKVSSKEKDIDGETSSIKSKSPKKKWF